MKTPISYYGGKQRIASKIVEYIHQIPHTVYSEPFFGGGAILYAKGKYDRGNNDYYREAINDKNKCLITFWRVAREQPEELVRWLELTPCSKEEYRRSREIYQNPEKYSEIEVAWATYIQCNMSFSNKIGGGWHFQTIGQNAGYTWNNKKSQLPECFARIKSVYIDCGDALDFINRWDSPQTLHYIDPPYPNADQGHYGGYTLDDYQKLCDKLDEIEGSYILSNYHQEIAPKSAQKCVEIEAVMSAAGGKYIKAKNAKRMEKLWICDRSPSMRTDIARVARMPDRSEMQQQSLFV